MSEEGKSVCSEYALNYYLSTSKEIIIMLLIQLSACLSSNFKKSEYLLRVLTTLKCLTDNKLNARIT